VVGFDFDDSEEVRKTIRISAYVLGCLPLNAEGVEELIVSRILIFAVVAITAFAAVFAWTQPERMDQITMRSIELVKTTSRPAMEKFGGTAVVESNPIADVVAPAIESWPPVLNQRFPELKLRDQEGRVVKLSDFAGRPLLIEFAAVSCPGCQGFAGGNEWGGFGGFKPQPGLESVKQYARRFAQVELGRDVVFVQLLVYGADMKPPTPSEVAAWASHFQMDRKRGEIVLQGTSELIGPVTHAMIPGFQLIDRDFVLRYDSCGHRPRHDFYRELLPAMGKLSE